jgi:hypothetical protein
MTTDLSALAHEAHTLVRPNTHRRPTGQETPSRRPPRRPGAQTHLYSPSRGVLRVSSQRAANTHHEVSGGARRRNTEIHFAPRHRTALSSAQKSWNAPRAVHQFPRAQETRSWPSRGLLQPPTTPLGHSRTGSNGGPTICGVWSGSMRSGARGGFQGV